MRLVMSAVAGAGLLGAAGCTVGPDFKPYRAPVAANWNDPSARRISFNPVSEASNPDPAWWNGFNDPVLTGLIHQAIAGNLDLQQALLRVVEARENVVTARSAGLPTLNGTASYNREQLGLRGILESEGIGGGGQSSLLSGASGLLGGQSAAVGQEVNSALNSAEQPIDLFQYGLNASWELDLFGRVRRSVEQARATTEAQAEAARDSLVMLESQVGQAYVQLRGAQALYATQAENIRAAQSSLTLTRRRRDSGLATGLDVDQAQTQLYNYQRQLPAYATQIQQAENQLSVLTGQAPGALDALLSPLPADFPWPILIAQHMPAAFTGPLARRLDRLCALHVVEVTGPTRILPGTAYVARGDADMILSTRPEGTVVMAAPADPALRWHPSVDRLVTTAMAQIEPGRLIGVLMTGMGNDGAAAMTRLRALGGRTIAEAEETAVVWGMPGELVRAGGAELVASLTDIARHLMSWAA